MLNRGGVITEADLRENMERHLETIAAQLPVHVHVAVETSAPGMVRVILREPRPRTWWRRALCAVADWILGLAVPTERCGHD